jgi:SAM-dependent methyltransferase
MSEINDPHRLQSLQHNRTAWDRLVESEHVLTKPANDDELSKPLAIVDGIGWLGGNISGWNVLCLAAGGGRHGPLYAAAGGNVTVVDISAAALLRDRQVAQAKGLSLRTVETSMDDLSMFATGYFDLVIHPVSTCYLSSLSLLFPAIARVTRPGGLYISQHKQPINLQASLETYVGQYVIQHAYYDPSPVPSASKPSRLREPGTQEYAHSWAAILGGICRSGFVIEDLIEPLHAEAQSPPGSFGHRCHFIAPYVRLKARRAGTATLGSLLTLS